MKYQQGILIGLGIFAVSVALTALRFRADHSPRPAVPPPALSVATTTTPSREYMLRFVGDIMLSRAVGKKIDQAGDPRYPFLKIRDALCEADLTFGNFEGTMSSRGANQGSIYSFRADPKTAQGLSYACFDVLSLANNHIWDWGRDALVDTRTLLAAAGIQGIGAGENETQANAPAVFTFGETTVGMLAYTNLYPRSLEATDTKAGISHSDMPSVIRAVQSLAERVDIVIVSFHWGDEYEPHPNALQRNSAHALIDAGADLVIGHHPHVAQDIEQYKDRWIAYSLGNFVFDQYQSKETMQGLMVTATLRDKAITSFASTTVQISSGYQPSL